MIETLQSTLDKLIYYIEKEEFKGYDPYDLLESSYFNKIDSSRILFIFSQINKRSPINLRNLLKIKPHSVPKGIALMLHAYTLLYKISPTPGLALTCHKLFGQLKQMIIPNYSGACWGINFDYVNRYGITSKNTPSSVVTKFAIDALYEFFSIFKEDQVEPIIISSSSFISKDLHRNETKEGICYSYTPKINDMVFNANGHSAEILLRSFQINNDIKYLSEAKKCIDFIVFYQTKGAYWNYSIDFYGKQQKQIDFHQGYIIDSLLLYRKISNDKSYDENIKRALEFYFEKQFNRNGKSLWHYPQKYPIDIHNQTQGIITAIKAIEFDADYLRYALKIANYTITNFQDKSGYFYYQKYPFFINKIPYIRWSAAWSLYAFSLLLNYLKTNKTAHTS